MSSDNVDTRRQLLETLELVVPDLGRTIASLARLEAIYFEHCRRRSFRNTMLHSRQAFERAMGLYVGAVLVAEKRAKWLPDGSGVGEIGGAGVLDRLEERFRDLHSAPGNARHDGLSRLAAKPWGSERVEALPPRTKARARKQSRDVATGRAEPKSFDEIMRSLEEKLAATVRPHVVLSAKRKRGLSPWASKSADAPYLPIGVPWPKSGREPLRPLVQIDLGEMPALPGFPRKGLVSFFVSEDGARAKVLYFRDIERDPRKLQSDFTFLDWDDVHDQSPYGGPAALSFARREGCLCWGDHRFEELNGKRELEALTRSPHYEKVYNRISRLSGSEDDRVGGYSSSQQGDPRRSGRAREYETLLLQVEHDSTTRSFFIKPSALARQDFSDVLYFEAGD